MLRSLSEVQRWEYLSSDPDSFQVGGQTEQGCMAAGDMHREDMDLSDALEGQFWDFPLKWQGRDGKVTQLCHRAILV